MKTNQAFISKPGETRGAGPLNIFGDLVWFKLAGSDNGGGLTIMEDNTPPRGGPPLHRHSREDEWFYVLEGDYVFEVDGKPITAGVGCSVFAPRGTAHTFQNISPSVGRMVIVAQPAGMDVFFTELAAATKHMPVPDMSVIVPIFEKHGIEFLGPPLAARAQDALAATDA
jgi:quercetin dioxygenase-like cupin family protein